MDEHTIQRIRRIAIGASGKFNSNASKPNFWESRDPGLLGLFHTQGLISQSVYDVLYPGQRICLECDSVTKFVSFKHGYNAYCGIQCSSRSTQKIQKQQQTCLSRYGVTTMLADNQRMKEAMLDKHGVENPQHLSTVQQKTQKTKQQRYGDQHQAIVEKVRRTKLEKYGDATYNNYQLAQQTCLSRYGVTTMLADSQRMKEAMLDKHGVINPSQMASVQQKKKNNSLRRRGVFYQQAHLTPNQVALFNSIDFLKEHTSTEIQEATGYSQSHVSKQLAAHGLVDGFRSVGERDISHYLDSLGVDHIPNCRSVISPYEIDLWIPEHRVGIEFHGAWYHSENYGSPKQLHQTKYQLATSQGIRLLQVFDFEWQCSSKQTIWKSMISNAVGQSRRAGARECEVVEISAQACNQFLTENHLQGACRSKLRVALTHKNDTVAVMTFGQSRFKKGEVELLRFSVKKGWAIAGAASKLMHHARQHLGGVEIISYSNNLYSDGNLYQTLGFENKHCTTGYFYVKGDQVLGRFQAQKHRLAALLLDKYDPQLTEAENMKNNGWLRIFDAGQTKWVLA